MAEHLNRLLLLRILNPLKRRDLFFLDGLHTDHGDWEAESVMHCLVAPRGWRLVIEQARDGAVEVWREQNPEQKVHALEEELERRDIWFERWWGDRDAKGFATCKGVARAAIHAALDRRALDAATRRVSPPTDKEQM